MKAIDEINEFLGCGTPQAWIEAATQNIDLLLIDHANCEKKAAGTAMNMMYRYVSNFDLLNKMSRLAREELKHFEQVIAIMQRRGIDYPQITASRYAAELRKPIRTSDPEKLIDTLIVGAIIEARSCERFAKLAPYLDEELQKFYESLLRSEARHYRDYLGLAQQISGENDIQERLGLFLSIENQLIEEADVEFRFHSGPPANAIN